MARLPTFPWWSAVLPYRLERDVVTSYFVWCMCRQDLFWRNSKFSRFFYYFLKYYFHLYVETHFVFFCWSALRIMYVFASEL